MQTKYTPGPWAAEQHATLKSFQVTTPHCADGLGNLVAFGIQDAPDARLIAAAPDLLEACQYVVDYHRGHDSGEGELFGLDFVTTCIAAIAKATK